MSQLFNKIKVANTSRSTFDLSHHQVTTSDFGYLIPICYRDMVPNDDFVVKPNVFVRLAPMQCPTYGRITCRIHHFFVPYRILYPHWDQFITQDPNNFTRPPFYYASQLRHVLGTDPAVANIPGGFGKNTGQFSRLMYNLGLNAKSIFGRSIPDSEEISAFPFLAYYRIWLDWFMDSSLNDHPSLVQEFNELIKDGGAIANVHNMAYKFLEYRNVCFKKDYFTSAKLSPQDGEPSRVGVDVGSDLNPGLNYPGNNFAFRLYPDNKVAVSEVPASPLPAGSTTKVGQFTIEALRAANSLQRYLERNNFVGTKLINRILAHFGVAPQPERLDMSEFIGGSSFPIQIGDVTSHNVNHTQSDLNPVNFSTDGLGAQAGKGVGAATGDSVRYHAKEHGVFMSLMSIVPDSGYYQGLSRFWTKGKDPLDYFTPEFENLGYQEILNKEVYMPDHDQYPHYDANGIFGYSPRYSEYKFQQDILAGDFVNNLQQDDVSVTGNFLDSWHLFRKLYYDDDNPLALNNNFVELNNKNNDYDRIFQFVNYNYDHFYFNIDVDVKATRPMSGFGEPALSANEEGDGNQINLPYGGTRL